MPGQGDRFLTNHHEGMPNRNDILHNDIWYYCFSEHQYTGNTHPLMPSKAETYEEQFGTTAMQTVCQRRT
jgi:hypothetical protein